ncbi:hypothetical protein ACWEKT_11565 [Nocardia takedensis]|uniref:hypothetical protein n=1 Tax=Nocardia takedensis TaxID=259390 RepID=UPI0003175F42|nr:hypothetical protein [Nocardia takedensis]
MSIEFGRSAAADRDAVARLRGASAGAISGSLSWAGHGWAAGGSAPDSTTAALLVAAAAALGALIAGLGPLRESAVGLVAALFGGQVLGHFVMGFGSGHLHHGDAQLSPKMLFGHLVAAGFAALLVLGAEAAYRIGTAALARVVPLRLVLPVVLEPAPPRTAHRDRVVLRIFAAQALRTRGPPSLVRS